MRSIAENKKVCQENFDSLWNSEGVTAFFDNLESKIREMIRITILRAVNKEFRDFIGVGPYERDEARFDHRNGFRYRDFETRFGPIREIRIPRARKRCFFPSIFQRYKRRETKIEKAVVDMFLRGISTRKVKKLSKALWGNEYSASTVSEFNKSLKEELKAWQLRPIKRKIRYLFLDAINLKLRRKWISKEAILCAIGISEDGHREFLEFRLGGRESIVSWEGLLLHLIERGLDADALELVTVDGNPGLLKALNNVLPETLIQRCVVHKLRNIAVHCPKSLRSIIVAEAKNIFSATSEQEARGRYKIWEERWGKGAPGAVECLKKDIDSCLNYYKFPYRHWSKIRTTNVIERVFREFRRRIRVMDSFPTEESCINILFGLVRMLNENWEYKPIKGF